MIIEDDEDLKQRLLQASSLVTLVKNQIESKNSSLFQNEIASALGVVDELLTESLKVNKT